MEESKSEVVEKEELPPGFRFHPTDEELITYYLTNKISDANFVTRAIGVVDLNKSEPWDLPGKAKMGEKEWYFYSLHDRKYSTGVRTNRATDTGYWKTTGKDKEIYNGNTSELAGLKKTLVFYRGRAPRGEKTNWIMHEYRIHHKSSYTSNKADEWVVCRVFQKIAGVKKHSPWPPLKSKPIKTPQNSQLPENLHPPTRSFVTPSETQQLNKVLFSNLPSQLPPPVLNYQLQGGDGGGFTFSNLKVHGGGLIAPVMDPPSGSLSEMTSGVIGGGGFDGDISNGLMGMEQGGDMDSYWPCY